MARILGNLVPEDEYTHPLGSEPNFNESMYFNFFDPRQRIGGFVRLGNRANEGRAEMTVCIYLEGGRVLFMFKRAPIDHNDAFDAGGLAFEVIEPTEHLRTTYVGSVIDMANPKALADPGEAFKTSPRRKLELDLDHRAIGPLYGGSKKDAEEERDADEQFGKAHYEQHMKVTGSLEIDGTRYEIEGFGLRDHSWGPRHWQAIESYEWLTMNFGEKMGAMISIVRQDAHSHSRGGVLVRGDELEKIREVEIVPHYDEGGLYHEALDVRAVCADGEVLEIRGEVEGFIPLRNRREGMVTHIGEGMTRWTLGDDVGYGLSELLRTFR